MSRPNKKNIALHILAGVLALAFLAAGSFKLMGAQPMVESFNRFGLPIWFLYFTGALEVVSALLIAFPRAGTRFVAAALLSGTMVGGALAHAIFDGVGQAIPALVLLALTLVQLYANRAVLGRILGRVRPDGPQPEVG